MWVITAATCVDAPPLLWYNTPTGLGSPAQSTKGGVALI
jgi:hypothetical protein